MESTHIDNAEKLFSLLDPSDHKWDGWYFRGLHQESYPLMPSAWRDPNPLFDRFKLLHEREKKETESSYSGFDRFGIDKKIVDGLLLRLQFENYLLSSFYHHSNRIGLKIPEQDFRYLDVYPPSYWLSNKSGLSSTGFESYKKREHFRFVDEVIFTKSLAQHHGTPTRLLDFTTNPRKALFFSFQCLGQQCLCANPEGLSCIYAINKNNLNLADKPHSPIVDITLHDRYANKFLHAQEGLFIEIKCGNFFFLENNRWPTLQEAYKDYAGGEQNFSFLKKITYPTSLRPEIYKKLLQCGSSVSHLMPHYGFISKEVEYELNFL